MTHPVIEAEDVVERYVHRELDTVTADAFEEHLFGCDECFAQVQELEALRSAVRQAAVDGTLSESDAVSTIHPNPRLPRAAAVTWMPMAAALALAAGLGWMAAVQVPALRSQLVEMSSERDSLNVQLKIAQSVPAPATAPIVEANIPMIALSSERGASDVPSIMASTARFIVMIDAPPSPSGTAQLIVQSSAGATITTVNDLLRNSGGLWVVGLSTEAFPPGVYRLLLRSANTSGAPLLGDYRLRVFKK